jgi:DNA invertase Pin-like site-specific DNA recombinase
MVAKITDQHRQKPAYVYVRQSTMGQVRHHQESTERQYALQNRALELGWPQDAIRTLDRDLGRSGAQMAGREDFKILVADVSMSQVGAVFALEASRLARSNLDWHRLLELCALTHTLVVDEDGCYDPGDFNDGLLLGLKGTMAQAELHFLRARLQGGKLNKAKRGELHFPLPVGFCYDDQGQIVPDPNEEVRGAVALVFDQFRQTGSALGVTQWFARQQLRFPKRAYGGAWNGQIIWGPLSHSRVIGILKNPSYAGVYVFGRYQYQKELNATGEIRTRMRQVGMPDWRVHLAAHHEGYITWDDFIQNQQQLAKNRTNGETIVLSGAAREGLALLQGLLLCGSCGHKLSVRYTCNGGLYPTYVCDGRRRDGSGTKSCMSVRCDLLDAALSEQVLHALRPEELGLALEALQRLEERDATTMHQWRMRLERMEYEAALAERRYQEVDPSNRLVARTLEQRWNQALSQLEELRKQYTEIERHDARVATPEQKARVMALAKDFPQLWKAPSTSAKDRKRMLRLLIRDITVERRAEARQVIMHIRWQGGHSVDVQVDLPPPIADRLRYPSAVREQVKALAKQFADDEIAEHLNHAGQVSAAGKPFDGSKIKWIRYCCRIPAVERKQPGEMTVSQLAAHIGVSQHVVYYWIERNVISARQIKPNTPYWITIDKTKERELRAWVRNSAHMKR